MAMAPTTDHYSGIRCVCVLESWLLRVVVGGAYYYSNNAHKSTRGNGADLHQEAKCDHSSDCGYEGEQRSSTARPTADTCAQDVREK